MKSKCIVVALAVALALTIPSAARDAKFKVLHNFGLRTDGAHPSGGLLLDDKGNLYGATGGGPGEYGNGVVFELMPRADGGWKEAILHTFSGGGDGADPQGALIFDGFGDLYGSMAGDSGAATWGVFELSRTDGWSNGVLYKDAAGPGLLIDDLGNLYGAMAPGEYKYSAVAELSPGSHGWTYAALYSFCGQQGCPDGYDPPAPPIWDGKGNLYGVTTEGGIGKPACFSDFGCGVIFKMTPNGDGTWTYHVLHRFASSSSDGQWPYGSLVVDADGNFYGSTWLGGPNGRENGGYGNGTVFKLALTGGKWEETILYDFPSCKYGCMAMGTLALDKAGNLYGTAAGGTGSCAGITCGVVFKLSPQKSGQWKYSVVHDFTAADGGVQPFYGVILDGKGNLFGVTSSFGKYNAGTAFEITP
jgi:hypothetical protein